MNLSVVNFSIPCRSEPAAISGAGFMDRFPDLSPNSLTEHWKKIRALTHSRFKSVQLPTSAVNMALPTFAGAPCCGPVLVCIAGNAANDCYLTRHADSSKSATLLQQANETDIRTDTVPLYRPSCAYYAGQCQKSPMGLHRPLDSSGGVATKLHHLQWQYLVRSFSCKEFMHVLTQLATLTLACEIVNVCCI